MNFVVRKNLFEETGASQVAFHILDFNRPNESLACLESIKRHAKFQHKVLFYSNGGDQSYINEFYKNGLIDICILSNKNEGSSIGTIRLAEISPCKYFFNLQCDNYLIRDIFIEEIEAMKYSLGQYPAIDLAWVQKGVFSERAFFTSINIYLENPFFTHAGTGPFQSQTLENSEQATTRWFSCEERKLSEKKVINWPNKLIADNGKYAIIETPCGGVLKRRCDSQELKIEKIPKQKMPAFNLSDSEWDEILAGKWQDWRIPKQSREWVFHFYSSEFEDPANELYRRK